MSRPAGRDRHDAADRGVVVLGDAQRDACRRASSRRGRPSPVAGGHVLDGGARERVELVEHRALGRSGSAAPKPGRSTASARPVRPVRGGRGRAATCRRSRRSRAAGRPAGRRPRAPARGCRSRRARAGARSAAACGNDSRRWTFAPARPPVPARRASAPIRCARPSTSRSPPPSATAPRRAAWAAGAAAARPTSSPGRRSASTPGYARFSGAVDRGRRHHDDRCPTWSRRCGSSRGWCSSSPPRTATTRPTACGPPSCSSCTSSTRTRSQAREALDGAGRSLLAARRRTRR